VKEKKRKLMNDELGLDNQNDDKDEEK